MSENMANTVTLETRSPLRRGFVIVIAVALVHSAISVLTILYIVGLGDTDTVLVSKIESVLFVVSAILRFPLLWIPEAWWSTMRSAFPPALNPFYIFIAANALLWGVAAALVSARLRSRHRADR